jgi:hypothetical protein
MVLPGQASAVDSLLNLDFLVSRDTVRLKYHKKQPSKNNNSACSTTPKGVYREAWPAELDRHDRID